jgi:hypothetical protein
MNFSVLEETNGNILLGVINKEVQRQEESHACLAFVLGMRDTSVVRKISSRRWKGGFVIVHSCHLSIYLSYKSTSRHSLSLLISILPIAILVTV